MSVCKEIGRYPCCKDCQNITIQEMNKKELNKIREENILQFSQSTVLFNLTKEERRTIQRIINRELKSLKGEVE